MSGTDGVLAFLMFTKGFTRIDPLRVQWWRRVIVFVKRELKAACTKQITPRWRFKIRAVIHIVNDGGEPIIKDDVVLTTNFAIV